MNESRLWREVSVDDLVEGSNGSLWAVEGIAPAGDRRRITMRHVVSGEERAGTPDPDAMVVVVISASEVLETAVALVTVRLGGQEIGTRLPGKNEQEEWICPVEYGHPGALMGHLYLHHDLAGAGLAGRALGALRALHAEVSTVGRRAAGYVEHVHDPRYAEVERERLVG